jgi:hypothetical protein
MKTPTLLLLALAAPTAALADAEPMAVRIVEDPLPDRDNRLSLNPLGAVLGLGSFTYERALTDHVSLTVLPSFMYLGFDDTKVYGGGLGLGTAFYVSGPAPSGLRFSLDVTPGLVSTDAETAFLVNGRAMLGYNWVWHSGFTLGLSGGVQYLHMSLEKTDVSFTGILPAAELNVGFVF